MSGQAEYQPVSDSKKPSTSPEKDGGWGWVIVLSCFLVHVIVDGTYFTFGVILVDIVVAFESSVQTTAWIGSLQASLTLILGWCIDF